MTTLIAGAVVLTVAGIVTYLGALAAETHRETHDLHSPVSRRALEQLADDQPDRDRTRPVSQ